MPLDAIAAITPDTPVNACEALGRAEEVCTLFRGARNFHNFCSPTRVPQLRDYARRFYTSLPFSCRKVCVCVCVCVSACVCVCVCLLGYAQLHACEHVLVVTRALN